MSAKDLKAPEKLTKKQEKVEQLAEVVQLYLSEDKWFSGVKKLTTSKKATALVSSLVGLVASGIGAITVVESPTLQATIAAIVMSVVGVVAGLYIHAQGKADGEGGKETLDREAKNAILAELTTALKDEITKAKRKKTK